MKTITLAMGQVPITAHTYPRLSDAVARIDTLNSERIDDDEPYHAIILNDEFAIVRIVKIGAIIHGLTWVLS